MDGVAGVELNYSHTGYFYECEDEAGCGLRFPVGAGEKRPGRCPRCGSGVAIVAQVVAAGTPESSNTRAVTPQSNLHLLLDNWRSVFNVGAAFRTADGAGVRHLYLGGISATPTTQPKVAKTALGAEQSVAWSYHANAVKLAQSLKLGGAQLWVLEASVESVSLFDIDDVPQMPVVLAAGNEVVGVDPALLALADRVLHVPMEGRKGSLNVAIALSIATYWLRAHEQRHARLNDE